MVILLLLVTTFSSVGCYGTHLSPTMVTDRCFTSFRDNVWAKRAYHLRYSEFCESKHPRHFRQGFIAGYVAVCNGEDGYTPPTPPRDYWSYKFQTAEGAEMIDCWFAGFPEGVKAATQDQAGAYRDMKISTMIDNALEQTPQDAWGPYMNHAPDAHPNVMHIEDAGDAPPLPTNENSIPVGEQPALMNGQDNNGQDGTVPLPIPEQNAASWKQ